MPAIRDYAFNYNATATLLHFTCPTPAYAQNDLLLAPVSADAGTQLWYGLQNLTSCVLATDGGGTYTDQTAGAQNTTASDCWLTGATAALNDACYFGHASIFNAIGWLVQTAGAGTQTWAWEYWNGTAWVALTLLNTGITLTAAAQMRINNFNPPTDWVTCAVSTYPTQYWVRMRISAYTSQTTRPVGSQAMIGQWNQLYSATNTVNQGVLYKIAGASEPADYTFAFTAADTANAAVLSIEDIDPNIPLSTAVQATAASQNASASLYSGSLVGISQAWTATAQRLAAVTFKLKKTGNPTGTCVVKLYLSAGADPNRVPTGLALAISNTLDVSTLTASNADYTFTFPWYYQYPLTAAGYCVTLEYSGGSVGNTVDVAYNTTSSLATSNKATLTGTTWTAQSTEDCYVIINHFTYATGTATAARSALPQVTTSRNDSIVLWIAANAGTSTTTLYLTAILEGPCSYLYAKDGTAHSDCLSWGFQRLAGASSAAVTQTNLGTGTQAISTAAVGVNPPASGATVIPPYPVSDASLYISPLTGVAYSGAAAGADSAPATTVTSVFGTTLNDNVLAAGASTVTLADVGINTYRAMVAATTVAATVASWYGVRQTVASRNLSGKNLLFHIQPATPIAIQTTDSVGLTKTCGIAIGLSSTANTNYSVYHVGGAFSSWGIQRHQPVIINTNYTGAGRIGNAGSLAPTAITDLGFIVSGKVVATSWLFGSAWALDTTVIAGGTIARPLNVSGIIKAAAEGYERKSIVSQGSSQLLILQPLRIGDGGTNAVVLKLDSTAIEFPQQYNKAAKIVYYCSVDNICGLKYYGGASDTIIHKNSVISSASRYFWGLHASHNPSCIPDFSGLSVIGAGTIALACALTITGLTINDYATIDASGLTLTYSTIKGAPAANDSITLTAASSINYCTIIVTGVAAGNRWCSVANPAIFTNCAFTGSATTGHAIRITTPGTYNLTDNTFTGFGADGSTSAAIFNDSAGSVTLNVSGGGTSPTIRNGAGAATTVNNSKTLTITGLISGSDVVIITSGTNTVIAEVDSNAGTSWGYVYQNAATIDIAVLKAGYVPYYVRGYVLGNSDAALPVSQDFDRAYQ